MLMVLDITQRSEGARVYTDGTVPTLNAMMGTGGGNVHLIAYRIPSYDSNAMKSSNPYSAFGEAEVTRTLDNNCCNPACNQGGVAVVQETKRTPLAFVERAGKPGGGKGLLINEGKVNCISTQQRINVVYEVERERRV